MTEHFGTRPKKGRGMEQASLDLINAMFEIAEATHPISGRGIGYKLFSRGLIESMSIITRKDGTKHNPMKHVYQLLLKAKEQGVIPWGWIVDEGGRDLERTPSWDDPKEFAKCAARQYRRDFWNEQPARVEVWSEKSTVRGVLAPVLEKFGVGVRFMRGFNGSTPVYDVAQDDDGRNLIVLYVGDYDPSGMCMSERDLPKRLEKYGGDHVTIDRVALLRADCDDLPSFPASDKAKDTRYKWFVKNYGVRCWELDAMDPNDLRDVVRDAIEMQIEPDAWARCEVVNKAEQESLRTVLNAWGGAR